ncbi:amidohydrolase family protein [Muriicola sp. Z0-33]|uniref:amidohydrolase family protein n=1 Tax=Muriicola sp. Z0-33 TaxID=2816957 RepID=UPI002238FF22|nr:amidohydrolase family protein [Muriicola sp. Z0-33]MCW5516009.1 amidohydrolase family protein [Muriicola sp. Z0-33]
MRKFINKLLIVILAIGFSFCEDPNTEDDQLVIVNASLFNTSTLQVEKNRSIFIRNNRIKKISGTRSGDFALNNVVDARERLITPSFIDVHNHLNFIFGDTTEITNPNEFKRSRKLLTEQYLPYGVTVVRSAGGRELHIPMVQSWMNHHQDYVDYFPSGGALVSLDTKFYNHAYVADSSEVQSKIREYHKLGIRHIKLYSLIGEPELKAAVSTARELELNIFGHIENAMISIETACNLGLTNFEHAKTLFLEVIRKYEAASIDLSGLPPDDEENWRYREYEVFNFIGADDPSILSLIALFKKNGVSITPTLNLYAQPIGLVNNSSQPTAHKEDQLNWSEEQMNRAKLGYKVLAAVVYKLYENGIQLNTGSDNYEPGKTILSEMLLLNDLGIPMSEVLKIASLNSARAIDMEKSYGSIEVGKKAHLVIFDENPLVNPLNLLSKKTVIKDGILWKQH